MPGDGLRWVFELWDRMTGPANTIATSVAGLESHLVSAQPAVSSFGRATALAGRDLGSMAYNLMKASRGAPQLTLAMQGGASSLLKTAGAASSASSAMGSAASMAGAFASSFTGITLGAEAAASLLHSLIGGVEELATSLVSAGYRFVEFGVRMSAFKESTLASFKLMEGSAEAAHDIFQQALDFARVTPFETEDVVKAFKQLRAAGFSRQEVPIVFQAVGDVSAASGFDKDVISRLTVAFAQIRSAGRLMGQDLMQVTNAAGTAGVGRMQIFEAIGKTIGKTREEAEALAHSGGIDADSAIFGILKAIQAASGGKVGNTMLAQGKTMMGLFSTIRSIPADWFLNADQVDATLPGLDHFKGTLQNIIDLFSVGSPKGKAFQTAILGTFDKLLTGVFGNLDTPEGLKRMEEMADRILKAFQLAGDMLVGMEAGADAFVKAFMPGLDGLAAGPDRAEKMRATFAALGTILGEIARRLSDFVIAMGGLAGNTATGSGGGILSSLGSALLSGWKLNPVTWGPQLIWGALGGGKASPALPAATLEGQPLGAAAGSGVKVDTVAVHLNIDNAGKGLDEAELARKVKETMPGALASAFEQMALERGALT